MDELKEKLTQFFNYIERQETPSISDVMNKFREIFKDEYLTHSENINTAYFQQKSNSYYIKNSCGIVLSVFSGDGDRFNGNVSHKGIDISIASLLSKDYECKHGIFIFDESIYCQPSLQYKIDSFFDYDLSLDNLKKNDDEFVYKTLPENIMKSNEIVKYRYNQLKIKAEIENSSLYDDYMISPYGGLDIDVIPADELLYGYLQKFKDDKYFFDKAIALFNCDFPDYFSEKINECSHALYIIKHQKQYETLLSLEESICQYEWNQCIDIDEINKERSDKQLKITELLEEKRTLSNKKYNLIELIKGTKSLNESRLSIINKSIENIKKELTNLDQSIEEYNEGIKYYTDLKNDYNALQDKLKKPFKNFSINEDFMYIYIDGEYGKLVSLERLICLKDKYSIELKELLENQSKSQQNYNYVKENFLNLKNNEDYEMEIKN